MKSMETWRTVFIISLLISLRYMQNLLLQFALNEMLMKLMPTYFFFVSVGQAFNAEGNSREVSLNIRRRQWHGHDLWTLVFSLVVSFHLIDLVHTPTVYLWRQLITGPWANRMHFKTNTPFNYQFDFWN